jgi:hypothetical protein
VAHARPPAAALRWAGCVADALAGGPTEQQLATNVSLSGNTVFSAGEIATLTSRVRCAKEFTGSQHGTNLQRQLPERIIAADYSDVRACICRRPASCGVLRYKSTTHRGCTSARDGFNAQSALATQLKTVAKMIAVGSSRYVAAIFFVATVATLMTISRPISPGFSAT